MKQLLKTIIRNVKSVRGNSLAEFATTTALMATLAATAAPKLSEMSEGAKGEKSRNEIDKIVKMAGQFYQDVADTEGRGRFPNQSKFNVPIGDSNGNGGDSYRSFNTKRTHNIDHGLAAGASITISAYFGAWSSTGATVNYSTSYRAPMIWIASEYSRNI